LKKVTRLLRSIKIGRSIFKISYLKIFKLASKLIRLPIDRNLLIFGGNLGKAFLGNTKYLFLYFNKYSNYNCIWISRSKEVIRNLQRKGYNSLYTYSLKALIKLKSAQCIFITHGENDILPIEFSPNTKIVFTWHGNPMKKIAFDDLRWVSDRYNKTLLEKLLKDVDYLLSPSEEVKKTFQKAFRMAPEKIVITGLPQNDFLFNISEESIKNLKKKYKMPEKINKIILYAPTYREDYIAKNPFTKNEFIELEKFLVDTNSLLIYKAHIFVKAFDIKEFKRIIMPDKLSDTQELLLISDILISDYSSIMHDFLLLQRPIIVFAYDFELFMKRRGMYYKDYEKIAPGPFIREGQELIKSLKNISEWDSKYESKRIEIRDLFNKYKDNQSCERVAKLLNLKTKKK